MNEYGELFFTDVFANLTCAIDWRVEALVSVGVGVVTTNVDTVIPAFGRAQLPVGVGGDVVAPGVGDCPAMTDPDCPVRPDSGT